MNKWQKEVLGNRNVADEQVLKELRTSYNVALKSIDEKIAQLLGREDKENIQSIIYQVEYQKALKTQISAVLDDLNTKQFDTISKYLKESYEDGFLGTMYDLQGQGVPLLFPIDEQQIIRALKTNSKLSTNLYDALGVDMQTLKRKVRNEISRGISQGYSTSQIAKNLAANANISYNNAVRIARTESHRISQEATLDAQFKAKEAGADVVKQWDASLDKRTRNSHRQLDGQIREIDEPFEINGHKAMNPGGFGVAALDINCRCVILQRAKWALDEEELETLKERAKYFGLDKAEDFEDYKKKYLKALDEEAKNPYEGKQYHMLPDGSLIEGTGINKDVFEITNKDNVELKDGKLYVKDTEQLNKVQTGEDFTQYTWSKSEDGTYFKGIVKNEAQYKLDIPNNKVLTINADKGIIQNKTLFETGIEKKYKFFLNRLPPDMQKEAINYINQGLSDYDAIKQVLQKQGYAGLNFVDKTGQINDFLDVFDDNMVQKTKKSKLETLTTNLATQQKKLSKIDNKTYTGIWKDDVKISDYKFKKGTIQAKKDYFNDMLSKYPTHPKAEEWKEYLADLDEFEKLGKEYEKLDDKISKINTDIKKLQPKTIDIDAYSKARKDNAYWFTDKNGSTRAADTVYRGKSGEVWRNAIKDEKSAIYEYTRSYNKFNEPLRGIEYGTNKYLGVGNVDLETIGMNYGGYERGEVKKLIDDMTSIIEKSNYDSDIWLQRGVGLKGMDKFFGVDLDLLKYGSEKELQKALLKTTPTEYGFMSTAVSKGKGFGGDIILNIYAPRGTKMMYAEPFSAFGMGDGKSWDGISKQSSFGGEAEMILQRGTQFRITKVERTGSTIYIDLEITGQSH